jgi:superfamily II DNA or RNA helicase
MSYGDELDMIISNTKRNKLISNLACSIEGNTLVLFQFVEKHGKVLYDMISQATDRPVYFIHGKIGGDERDNMRKIVEQQDNAIIVASVQTFSTGINIKSLKNIIFSSPSKSRIRTLQSIGRVLRRSETKTDSILYDIADNLTWKSRKNYTLQHFIERVKIYTKENFPYKLYTVRLDK